MVLFVSLCVKCGVSGFIAMLPVCVCDEERTSPNCLCLVQHGGSVVRVTYIYVKPKP